MSRLRRLHDTLAHHSPWIVTAFCLAVAIAGGVLVRREHLPEECLPATCTIYATGAAQAGPSTWNAVIRFEAVSEQGEPVGRFRMNLDAKGDTRERAEEIADNQRRHQEQFACYYHPLYRGYLVLGREGAWGIPLAVTIVFSLGFLFMVALFWLDLHERPRPDGRRAYPFDGRSPLARLYRLRDFLPEEPPSGWSVPFRLRDQDSWIMDAGDEGLMLRLERSGPFWAVRAFITTRGGAPLPSDGRCAEILGQLRGLGEWMECNPGDCPATRVWLAFPRAQRPRFRVPEGLPWPPEAAGNPALAAARKYLPDKLPEGWSLPVAVTGDHGTGWKKGGWIMAVDETLMAIVALCTSEGRERLAVALFHRDGSEVGDAEAVDVLRHFRGVYEFAQSERSADESFVAYFGEISAKRRDPATLN
jgi:hypothetical protein